MAADLPLNNPNYILSEIYSVKYLDSGFVSIVNQSGTFLDHEDFWENEKLNKSYPELWNKLNYSDECHFFIHHYEIYRVAGYKLAVKLTESTTDDGDSWDYMVLMVVKESEIMKYRNESKDKLESASVMLIAITLTCSIITIAVVTILIHFLAKSITTPLKGIIEFTNKINAKATEKDMVTKEELDKLKEGDDQVAELVRTYKELAGSLINKKEENVPKPFQVSQNRVFPRNEMYQKNKIDWKKLLDSLSDN
jgi:sensor histidine kinase YesM